MRIEKGRDWTVYLGDCLEILPTLETGSISCIIADPPYEAKRPSAWRSVEKRFTEIAGNDSVHSEWLRESYRLLKDSGSLYLFTCWQTME